MSFITKYFLLAILLLENYSLPNRFFPTIDLNKSIFLHDIEREMNQNRQKEILQTHTQLEKPESVSYDEYCKQFQNFEDGSEFDLLVNSSNIKRDSGLYIAAPRFASFLNQDFNSNLIDNISWHNGIIYDEAGEYTIEGANITMLTNSSGLTTNDFTGLGAAIGTYGEGIILNINNTKIETSGVAKLSLFIDNGSVVIMTNSTIITHYGTLYDGYVCNDEKVMMVTPPWVLGIGGPYSNIRSLNIVGSYTVGVFIDTIIQAAGWGAISTDDSSYARLYVINTQIIVNNSGYGAFSQDGTSSEFYGVYKNVETYLAILKKSNITYKAYRGEDIDIYKSNGDYIKTVKSNNVQQNETVYSKLISNNFGFLFFCESNKLIISHMLNILDGTDIETEDAIFLVKKANFMITIDNSTLKSNNNVLLQILDDEDDYIGLNKSALWGINNGYGHYYGVHGRTKNSVFKEPEGYSYSFADNDVDIEDNWISTLIITNAKIEGNIWDSTGYIGENPATTLNVSLGEGATLIGLISAGAYSHLNKSIIVGDGDWSQANYIGHVENVVYSNGKNLVYVSLKSDAVWYVTQSCYIDDLIIEDESIVIVPKGVSLKVKETEYTDITLEAEFI